MSQFWSPLVRDLTPYVPGEQPRIANLIKLNTNENPYGPSPRVLAAVREQTDDRLRLYPDPDALALKQAIGAYHGLSSAEVFVSNSSDDVLGHAFQAFFVQDLPILAADITYGFYPSYCRLYGIDMITVPLDEQLRIRVADYAQPCGGVVLANPNAPTGIALPLAQVEQIIASQPQRVVLVDEAYVDFGAESAASLVARYPNLLVVQTFSKSRSLAGLRVAFALGQPALIEALERVKNSFNAYPLDRLAIAGALAAIEDEEYFQSRRAMVIATREQLALQLAGLGFEVLPSMTNFLFVRHPGQDAPELAAALRARAILVRHFRLPRIDQYLRTSIGTDEECAVLVAALAEILTKSQPLDSDHPAPPL